MLSGLSKESERLIESLFEKYMTTPIEDLRKEARDPFYTDVVATLSEMEKVASEAYWDYVSFDTACFSKVLQQDKTVMPHTDMPDIFIPSKAEFSISDVDKWQKAA